MNFHQETRCFRNVVVSCYHRSEVINVTVVFLVWQGPSGQETADLPRKPEIFAENRRKPQIGLRHLRSVTFSSALSAEHVFRVSSLFLKYNKKTWACIKLSNSFGARTLAYSRSEEAVFWKRCLLTNVHLLEILEP